MAKSSTKKTTSIALLVIAVIVFVGIGTGAIDPQQFSIGSSNAGSGGTQTSPNTPPPTGVPHAGQLTVTLVQRDALDLAETRTDATNVVVNYYTRSGNTYIPKGASASNTVTFTVPTDADGAVYFTAMPASGQSYFISPNAIADRNTNQYVSSFDFIDITGDGTAEWLFRMDLRDVPAPTAGQTASTIILTVLSYDDGSSTLSSPADQTSISTTANTQTWIRWDNTVGAETADPVYELEVRFNTTNSTQWDEGQTIVGIPNIGDVALSDPRFIKSDTSTLTKYKYTLGNSLENANFITTPQNGNTLHPMNLKVQHSLSAAGTDEDTLSISLWVRSKTPAQGNAESSDCVIISTNTISAGNTCDTT